MKGIISLFLLLATSATAQVRYTGNTLVNVDYHHGQLRPVAGVRNIQVMRADRDLNHGWTYNHAPMLAYWRNSFYLEYLSEERGESIPRGQTLYLLLRTVLPGLPLISCSRLIKSLMAR